MQVALFDIATPLADRIRPYLTADDVIVDVPASPDAPVPVDVLIASRFAAKEAARVTCRLLQAPGAGTDKIDFALVAPEATICNAYEHEVPIAEYVFAAILDHALGYGAMTRQIADKGWGGAYYSRPAHGEVAGQTIGIIGLGHIGAAIARRAKAFDMAVMAVTASRREGAAHVDWIATSDRLFELLTRSDYVVVACPLTDTTRGMLSMRQFKAMKPSALLINVARAEIAEEADLYTALKDGLIAGAVLDAWYRYPTSANDAVTPSRFPFDQLANVRMTPHSAAWTDGIWQRRCVVFGDNIARLRAGEPLLNVVRPPGAAARQAVG
jgi:phosphoglycerate dehydrogenase-like enzyme